MTSGYVELLRELDFDSRLPKYRQVIQAISRDIRKQVLKPGDRIPSINEASSECYLSRDTVEKAYKELTKRGIIQSIPGKGFFVAEEVQDRPLRLLAVFDRLDEARWELFHAITQALAPDHEVTMLCYEHNYRLLNLSLEEHQDDYDFFIVIPHFFAYQDDLKRAFSHVPVDRLIVLTHHVEGLDPQTSQFTFDRKNAWLKALHERASHMAAFHRLLLFFPDDFRFPQEIHDALEEFCDSQQWVLKVIPAWDERKIQQGDLIFVLEDEILALIVALAEQRNWTLGKELGVVSFEESPFKAAVAGGISTLAYDFEEIARTVVARIQTGVPQQAQFPLRWFVRASC